MAADRRTAGRQSAVSDLKRGLILEAARRVFEAEGLEGASLRAIAAEAGYTPAALYFHFDSKEAIYAEVLHLSLAALGATVTAAIGATASPAAALQAASMAFFGFYAQRPRDLELGFYLFRGGLRPAGLGRERDEALNAALERALLPIAESAEALGATPEAARMLMVDSFAHATGLLLLAHTGRIRMFGASAETLMAAYVGERVAALHP